MRRFIPEICDVECGSRGKSGSKFDVFFAPQIFGASEIFMGHLQIDTHSDLLAKFGCDPMAGLSSMLTK